MSFDWTTFALQLINVLILLAILRHFLFRPIAAIIAQRQAQTQAALDQAERARQQAEAATAAAQAEAQANASARAALLTRAQAEAQAARQALLAKAQDEATRIIAEGRALRQREDTAAQALALDRARDLAGDIARRVLAAQPATLSGWLDRLTGALAGLDPAARAALLDGDDLRLISATPLTAQDRSAALAALHPFGATPRPDSDPALIAGVELRSGNAVLRNSLAHDLDQIAKAMRDAPQP